MIHKAIEFRKGGLDLCADFDTGAVGLQNCETKPKSAVDIYRMPIVANSLGDNLA